jgi:predicted DNA-binding transcriptional regulator YafY
VDAIETATVLELPAQEIADAELDRVLAAGYGIFSGEVRKQATLRFSRERARWVACEVWHAEQRGTFDARGRYCLELPYSDDRELIMDILRHGPEVEVLAPRELRQRTLAAARVTMRVYLEAMEKS